MSPVDVGRWADTLMARYADHDVTGSALFPLLADGELEMVPLAGHPAEHLRWYRPPADCIALGLVSAGWAAPIDSPVRPSAHPDAQRVVQAVVVARDGAVGARIRFPDGSVVDPGTPGTGRVLDALRRSLRRLAA